jgi:hypothetical protein
VVECFGVTVKAEQGTVRVGGEEGLGVAAETDGGINEQSRGLRPQA